MLALERIPGLPLLFAMSCDCLQRALAWQAHSTSARRRASPASAPGSRATSCEEPRAAASIGRVIRSYCLASQPAGGSALARRRGRAPVAVERLSAKRRLCGVELQRIGRRPRRRWPGRVSRSHAEKLVGSSVSSKVGRLETGCCADSISRAFVEGAGDRGRAAALRIAIYPAPSIRSSIWTADDAPADHLVCQPSNTSATDGARPLRQVANSAPPDCSAGTRVLTRFVSPDISHLGVPEPPPGSEYRLL